MEFLINVTIWILLILFVLGVTVGIYLLYLIHNIVKKLNENDE
jgi:hypothetical protein